MPLTIKKPQARLKSPSLSRNFDFSQSRSPQRNIKLDPIPNPPIEIKQEFVIEIDSPKKRSKNRPVEDDNSPLFKCDKKNDINEPAKIDAKIKLNIMRRSRNQVQTFVHRPQVPEGNFKSSFGINEGKSSFLESEPTTEKKRTGLVRVEQNRGQPIVHQTSPRGQAVRSIMFPPSEKIILQEGKGLEQLPLEKRKQSSAALQIQEGNKEVNFVKPTRTNFRHKTEMSAGQSYKENNAYHLFVKKHKEQLDLEASKMIDAFRLEAKLKWSSGDSASVDSRLQIGFKMGEGTFASVYEGYDKLLKRNVAIKVIDKAKVMGNQRLKELVEREVAHLANLPHCEQVCQFYRLYEDSCKVAECNQVYIVLEFCGSRTLSSYMKNFGPLGADKVKSIFKEIVAGVEFLHSHHIYHRDLKLENILLTSLNKVKIVDLGLSTRKNDPTTEISGTPAYFTPEQIRQQPYTPSKVDIWCLGVILHYLTYGKHPFGGRFWLTRHQRLRFQAASGKHSIF